MFGGEGVIPAPVLMVHYQMVWGCGVDRRSRLPFFCHIALIFRDKRFSTFKKSIAYLIFITDEVCY